MVLVAYGAPDYLRQALEPLGAESVVVVDNSSSPTTRELVRGLGHHYVDARSNLGFAGGVNAGLRSADELGLTGDVLLLNPDARIESHDIDLLQARLLAEDDVAAVAPRLVTADGETHLSWFPLMSPGQLWRAALGLPVARGARHFLIGAVLLLRAEALADIGGLDEHYFLYGEEADWQRRALDRGWRLDLVPAATGTHHGGMSSDDDHVRQARVAAGQETYVRRWYGVGGWTSYRMAGWVWSVLNAARPGDRAMDATRARSFRLGPRRAAPLPPEPRPLAILHVLSGSAESAELSELVSAQREAGHDVTVIAAPSWSGTVGALRGAVRRAPLVDVVHAHGLAATSAACLLGPWHGARVVSSSRPSDTPASRILATLVDRRVDVRIEEGELGAATARYRAAAMAAGARKMNIA
ncbi:glycosyltransferase [Nocardioides sp. Kera G14]|uniref:glycosyltransferase n=1 Tax=Nocardioides sp. Kera G14 TaxID=2884264 RepID=UPI001D12C728|nr:glycosyltransferase family 2 protein [Nocardioides sp. Kera G14]UDY23618.1 glycosyltransferase family 2 protein [Nocardioides sp. Kera G14]